jgi:hypothetical protein
MSIIYVDADVASSGNGTSWGSAYKYLTDAITAAQSGDQIWVAEGVYYPDEGTGRTDNDPSQSFSMKENVAIYGGFAGTETSLDQRDWQTHKTILSGDIDQNDTNDDGNYIAETPSDIQGTNGRSVVSNGGINSTAILDGFIITGGSSSYSRGGGMYNSNSSPTVNNVTFSGNIAVNEGFGGGMYNSNSSPTVSNVTFSGNMATLGGGMYNNDSSPTVSNVTFSGNIAGGGGSGGGMYNEDSSPTVSNTTFSENSASVSGGGMYNYLSDPTISNVIFSGNSAGSYGGGLRNVNGDSIITNATFYDNYAYNGGGAIANTGNSFPTISNTIIWGNAPSQIVNDNFYGPGSIPIIAYSLIQGSGGSSNWDPNLGTDGGGNLDSDPLFVDPTNGNLQLLNGSPAIDTGDNSALPPDTADLDRDGDTTELIPFDFAGEPRIKNSIVDMGAYEYGVNTLPMNLDADGNGIAQGSTDGILIARYLFGFHGDALISGAVAPNATRTTATDIENYLFNGFPDSNLPYNEMLDVDGNGIAQGSTDGILIARYLFGFSGDALINGAIGANATRNTAIAIDSFLDSFMI